MQTVVFSVKGPYLYITTKEHTLSKHTIMINLNFAAATNSQIEDFSTFLNEHAETESIDNWDDLLMLCSQCYSQDENHLLLDEIRQCANAKGDDQLIRCMEAFFASHIVFSNN